VIDYLAHVRNDVDAVLAVLATADGTEPVPHCPGWTLRDLVLHLGGVHRWATTIVRTGSPAEQDDAADVDDLSSWFAAGAEELIAELAAADPSAPCWSFTRERNVGFWLRRQALETVVHRWDAQSAIGEPAGIDPVLAADGVAEVVTLMTPRQVAMERIPRLPLTVLLQAIDTGDDWALGDGRPSAGVEATAETLLLLLWHRIDPGDPRARTTGDAEQVLRMALAP
jgi:uncharacterized protein (TIGR03083 family)